MAIKISQKLRKWILGEKFLILLLAVTLLIGCPSPQPPQPPDPNNTTTTIDKQQALLNAAINTGCAMNRTYIALDKYWVIGADYIPPDLKAKALFAAKLYLKFLKTYNAGIIAWQDRKAEPENWAQTVKDLQEAYNAAVPLIKEIIAAVNKKSKDEGLMQAGAGIPFEGVFDCDFPTFKDLADKVSGLADLK